ncbi:MAG: CTP synthase, partial [Anaerolineae bacterium]
ALHHAGLRSGSVVEIDWIDSEVLERHGPGRLAGLHGIVVPGGFGYRGIEGKIVAARFAREERIPYLGLCLGMQVMVIELARHVLDSDEPNSTEFDIKTEYPVIDLMVDQRDISEMGGTMRLGLYPCQLLPGSRAAMAYANFGGVDAESPPLIQERHRHRFEVNNAYRQLLTDAGMVFSGVSPDGRLIEVGELADHPFMVGSQFHPELRSRPTRPHPLFQAFVRASTEYRDGRKDRASEKEE